jgi:hypothetical protein
MTDENIKWLFELIPKDGGKKVIDIVKALNLREAVNSLDNEYGLNNFENFYIERVD